LRSNFLERPFCNKGFWENPFQNRLYRSGAGCGCWKLVERKTPTVIIRDHQAAKVKNVNLPTGEEHWRICEKIDAVKTYSESPRSGGIESLVTAGDFTDSLEVILIHFRDLSRNAKRCIVADEQSWFQQRSIHAALRWKILSVPLVQSHNQLGGAGIVCVLKEFLDDRATE
jgi:hypothetical protein